MGANSSYMKVVQKIINENRSKMNCTASATNNQSIELDGLRTKGNCKLSMQNHSSMKSNCDMSSTYEALTSQKAIQELEQASNFSFSANSAVSMTDLVTKGVNEIKEACEASPVDNQTIRVLRDGVECKDGDDLDFGNFAEMEANCVMAAAAKVITEQTSKHKTSQTQESVVGSFFNAFLTPLLIVGAIVAVVVLVSLLLGKATPPKALNRVRNNGAPRTLSSGLTNASRGNYSSRAS